MNTGSSFLRPSNSSSRDDYTNIRNVLACTCLEQSSSLHLRERRQNAGVGGPCLFCQANNTGISHKEKYAREWCGMMFYSLSSRSADNIQELNF